MPLNEDVRQIFPNASAPHTIVGVRWLAVFAPQQIGEEVERAPVGVAVRVWGRNGIKGLH